MFRNSGVLPGALCAYLLLFTLAPKVEGQTFRPIPALSFTKGFAGSNPLPQTITVTSAGAQFDFRVASSTATGGDWLSVTGCGGTCSTPYALTVTVNPSVTLVAGTYSGQIVLTERFNTTSLTIPVALTIAAAGAARLDSLPGQLSFAMSPAGAGPPSQTLHVRNGGPGALNWTLTAATSDGGNWLNVSAATGAAPSPVVVAVNPAGLPNAGLVAGSFTGHLTFQTAAGSATVPVSVTVSNNGFRQIQALGFNKVFGGVDPLPQVLHIASTGDTFDFRVTSFTSGGGDWLSVTGCGGTCSTPYALVAQVKPAPALAAGTYMGQIVLTERFTSRAMTIAVTLTISTPGSALFDAIPGHLSFSLLPRSQAPDQTLAIRNGGTGTLNWTVTPTTADSGGWLSVSASAGVAPSLVTVSVDVSKLPNAGFVAGTYVGHLLFESGAIRVSVPVSVVLGDAVFRQASDILFTKPLGGADPLSQTLSVASTGNSFDFRVTSFAYAGGDWLTVTGCGGTCSTPHAITVAVNPAVVLAAGTYTGQIVFTERFTSMAMTVPVTLSVVSGAQPLFDNLPGQLSFSLTPGSGNPQAQPLHIRNVGAGVLSWVVFASTSDGGNWLTVPATSGAAPSTVSVGVNVSALPGQGLVPGTFSGQLEFRALGTSSSVTVPVSVVVGASVFSQLAGLNFTMMQGGQNPLPQALAITSTGASFDFRAAEQTATGGDWLAIAGCGGTCSTPTSLTATVNAPSGLKAGTYTGQIVLTERFTSMAMTVPVTLTVEPGPSCTFSIAPASATFTENGGRGSFRLTATGTPPCAWTARSSESWVQVFPLSGSISGDIGYTVFPNFRTTPRTATITAGGRTFTITQAAGTGVSNRRFVRLLYYFFFGRIPMQSDIDFQLNSGLSRTQLAVNFFRGGEFLLGGRYVGGLYLGLLDRDAEYGGWAFQRNALASGNTAFRLEIVANFLNSPEYKLKFGIPDNATFIRLLYEKILLRTPPDADVAWHVGHLTAGMSRAEKASNFLASGEFQISSGPRMTAALLYFTLLQRDPTEAERQEMIDLVRARTPDQVLIERIITRPEFGTIVD